MKRAIAAVFCAALFAMAAHAKTEVVAVWNGVAPGSESWTWSEESNISKRDKTLNLRNIVAPTLTVYPAAKPNGTGVLVIPGGGFANLGYGKEGEEIARWFNAAGVTAFVLKYRLARSGDEDAKDPAKLNARIEAVVPLAAEDALQAVRLLRSRAAEWGVKKLGVIGFSAGGLLAVGTSVWLDKPLRPDFLVAVYAAVPRQFQATAESPPAFIVVADGDRYGTDASLQLYKAWHEAHAPVELHIYDKGDHGFALRKTGTPTDRWTERLKDWMTDRGYVPKR